MDITVLIRLRIIFFAGLIFTFSACGGGGGGPSFPGVYEVKYQLLENHCRLSGVPNTFSSVHTVNQDRDYIILDATNIRGRAVFQGGINEENDGFFVFHDRSVGRCHSYMGIAYGPSDRDEFVSVFIDQIECGTSICEVVFGGYVEKKF